jgi:hypothetical protein
MSKTMSKFVPGLLVRCIKNTDVSVPHHMPVIGKCYEIRTVENSWVTLEFPTADGDYWNYQKDDFEVVDKEGIETYEVFEKGDQVTCIKVTGGPYVGELGKDYKVIQVAGDGNLIRLDEIEGKNKHSASKPWLNASDFMLTSSYKSEASADVQKAVKEQMEYLASLKVQKPGEGVKKGAHVVVVGYTDTGAMEYFPAGHKSIVKKVHPDEPWVMLIDKTPNGYQQWYHKNDFVVTESSPDKGTTPAFEEKDFLYVGFSDYTYATSTLGALESWMVNVLYVDGNGELDELHNVMINDVGHDYVEFNDEENDDYMSISISKLKAVYVV